MTVSSVSASDLRAVAQPASDLDQSSESKRGLAEIPRLGEWTPSRPFEPAAPARHRERHLRLLGAHAELAEEAIEQRVVPVVVDEEARVEREAVVLDGVHVAAEPGVLLEDVHVVGARQDVRRAEPGHARSDHGDPHWQSGALGASSLSHIGSPSSRKADRFSRGRSAYP